MKMDDLLNPFAFFDYSNNPKKYTYLIDFKFIYCYNILSIQKFKGEKELIFKVIYEKNILELGNL